MTTYLAPAKINLYLQVTGKRDDGYHLLDSLAVFAKDITDKLSIEAADDFTLEITGPFASALNTADNLVVKAAQRLSELSGKPLKAKIRLEKNIPLGAGLGGGSADAAAAIKGLLKLWDVSLPTQKIDELLLSLGADVPVCYHGKSARFEGIGEKISDVAGMPACHILLVWPQEHAATKDVFAAWTKAFSARVNFPKSFGGTRQFIEFLNTTSNDLTEAAESLCPQIKEARDAMQQLDGCLLARMSGSGSSVFGIFESATLCALAYTQIRQNHPQWWAHTSAL